jgi:hypothetical protein
MPGVSGELKVSGPPISEASAKEPGEVPAAGVFQAGGVEGRSWRRFIGELTYLSGSRLDRLWDHARFPTPVRTGSGSTGASQRPTTTSGPRPELSRGQYSSPALVRIQ